MPFERLIIFWIAALLVFVGRLWLSSSIPLPFAAGTALARLLTALANSRRRRANGSYTARRAN